MVESKKSVEMYSDTIFEERSSPIAFETLTDQQNYYAAQTLTAPAVEFMSESQNEEVNTSSGMGINGIVRPIVRVSSTNTLDQLVTPLTQQNVSINVDQYPINQDSNPEQVRRANGDRIVYRQDIAIRYLRPPTPPAPGPIIIREIRPPQLPEAPPLVIRQPPVIPPTPPPLIIREKPPLPPTVEPTRVMNKLLPAPPPPKRKVIIHRQAPLPQKPQPVIIEKWLPYPNAPERKIIVERAPPIPERPPQRNMVITWDAPHVDLVKNVHSLGTIRVDPTTYMAQYGSQLSSSEVVLNAMSRFGIANTTIQTQTLHVDENIFPTMTGVTIPDNMNIRDITAA